MRLLGSLRAVVDPTARGRESARELAPEVKVCADPGEVWDDSDIAAVMIATPAASHYSLAVAALDAGRDVFVEKPLTVDLKDARDLVARARAAGRILMVGHLLEYHPAIDRLRKLVADGTIGDLRYISSTRLNLGKIRTEENALWSFAPHDIAVIVGLVGRLPVEVVATGGAYVSPNVADVTVTQFLFDNGVRSHIYVSWLHPFKEQRLVVIGSRKMVSFCDVTKELVTWDVEVEWKAGQPIPVRHDGVRLDFDGDEPLRLECQHFLECVETRRTPRTDGTNGVTVLELLQASQRSMATNGTPVGVRAGSIEERARRDLRGSSS
jgi:predicted dehydrogenase